MHIGILFYSESLSKQRSPGAMKGRLVANESFIHALLANCSHPITLIVTSPEEVPLLKDHFEIKAPHNIVHLYELANYLQTNPLDIVHIQSPNLFRATYLRDQLNPKNAAVTGITHSLGSAPFQEWLKMNLLGGINNYDHLICTSNAAISVCSHMQSDLLKNNPQLKPLNLTKIPLGINSDSLKLTTKNIRQELSIPKAAKIVLCFGRISHASKMDLQPILLGLNHLQDFHLIIAGASPDTSEISLLNTLIQSLKLDYQVHILQNPDADLKNALYQQADVFIAPSDNLQETFGISLVEAQASGLPQIASDWSGYRDIVQDGKTGFLIPTMTAGTLAEMDLLAPLALDTYNHSLYAQQSAIDIPSLRNKLSLLLNDAALHRLMAENSLKLACNFEWKNIISQYLTLWTQLAAQANQQSKSLANNPCLQYSQSFASFASSTLKADDSFVISPLGLQALGNELALHRYSEVADIFDFSLLAKILNLLKNPLNFEVVTARLSSVSSEDDLRFHILWLYKYALIEKLAC